MRLHRSVAYLQKFRTIHLYMGLATATRGECRIARPDPHLCAREGMMVPPPIYKGGPPGSRGFPGGGLGGPKQRGAGDVIGQGYLCIYPDPGSEIGCGQCR